MIVVPNLAQLNHIDNINSYYPQIFNALLQYIIDAKSESLDSEFTDLFDLIMEFCIRSNLNPEIVADVIQDNSDFYDYLKLDCINHGVISEPGFKSESDW